MSKLKVWSTRIVLVLFLLISGFQFYRLSLQGLAEFQFKPVLTEIPKAYSLDIEERQKSIANISNGELWLEVLNRIRFAISLDPAQARYYKWLGLAFTARSAAVAANTDLQMNLLREADRSFVHAMRLNPADPYTIEHLLLSKARLGEFGRETELLFKNILLLGPRESQIHMQVLMEYLPRYAGMSAVIKKEINALYLHLNTVGGQRKEFEIRQYANRLQACRVIDDESQFDLVRWPEHICNDIAQRWEKLKRTK